jgi:hypothetical protein
MGGRDQQTKAGAPERNSGELEQVGVQSALVQQTASNSCDSVISDQDRHDRRGLAHTLQPVLGQSRAQDAHIVGKAVAPLLAL